MALSLVVEDGSGLEDSNSYVSVAEVDDYWTLRNEESTGWGALSDEDKIRAIIIAAQYLDYSYTWEGDRYSSVQALSWPRVMFMDRDYRAMYAHVIPQRLKDAQCELAREQGVVGPILANVDRGGRVQNETLGPLSVTYFEDAAAEKEFPLVDRILRDLIIGGSGSLTVQSVLS